MSDYFVNCPDNQIPKGLTTGILKESDALSYHQALPGYQATPIWNLSHLAKKYGVANIFVKDESLRFGLNAFKGLGASYAIHKLLQKNCDIKTFCTATDGNHGKAVAWASRILGRKAVVFVPKHTTTARISAIEKEGARVILTKGNYDEACELAEQTSACEEWQLVQDTSWENYEEIPANIMAGYLTMFRELENSVHLLPNPKIDLVFLQAGVGSWAGSAIWYYLNRYGEHRPKIVLVEPLEADGIFESFREGKRVMSKGNFQTIMAGLNCGIPSLNAWKIIQNGADISIRIEDQYTRQAMRELYYPEGDDKQIIAGESGAAGLAGFIAIMTQKNLGELPKELQVTDQSNILFYNTEGDTDQKSYLQIINSIEKFL